MSEEAETSEVLLIRRTFGNMKKAVRSWGKYVPWPAAWRSAKETSLCAKVVQLLLRAGDEAKLEVKEREAWKGRPTESLFNSNTCI